MAKKIPEGFHTVTPSIIFKDATKAIEFYKKALGAKEDSVMRSPDGKVMHACITIGNSKLFIFDEQNQMAALSGPKSSVNFYLYLDDADAAFKQAIAAGCKEFMPVQDMFWGDRLGVVTDPFGYAWNLATHVRDVSDEEMRKAAAEACSKHKAA